MNSNNLQEWWENTYRHHLTKQQQQINFDTTLTPHDVGSGSSRELLNLAALQQTLDDNNISEDINDGSVVESNLGILDYDNLSNITYFSPYDGDRDEHTIPSLTLLFMAISYGLVVFGGVLGNATLLLTLCSASSVRLRNPLLLAVCIADLLVTGISAPVTLLNLAMNRKTKTLPLELCKVIDFIQATPVAASTLSFFLLSLDRYATVKHPRLAQLRQRRYLHVSLAVFSWLTSAIVSVPFLFIYKIVAKTVVMKNASISSSSSSSSLSNIKSATSSTTLMATTTALTPSADFPNVSISCHSDPGANPVFVVFILIHTFIVFILPGLGVLLNHYGVRRKLCALSLTARAAHGELPLPMPILRRQTHMVIVTGVANAHQAGCGGATDDTSNGGDIQMQNLNPRSAHGNRNVILSKNPISPRFIGNFRVSKSIFLMILDMLQEKWKPSSRSSSIRPDIKLATFLRFLATGSYQRTLGNESASSTAKSTVNRIIAECLELFEKWICPKYIKMPQPEDERIIKENFYERTGFPGVIGCVDGTHIRIKSPGDNEKKLYYNRKGYCSINAMMICDHNMTIMFVDARHPGSNHDAFIWEHSGANHNLQRDFDQGKRNLWILGDGGYKLKTFLMTPYRSPKDIYERRFNKKHASTRNVVERCFGLLKNRFRAILGSRGLHYSPQKATKIINACCAMHNICIKYKFFDGVVDETLVDNANDPSSLMEEEEDNSAMAIRRNIAINL